MSIKEYSFDEAILDKLLKENKITYEEWYLLLLALRKRYSLRVIKDNINIVDISTK